jgi:hypothetical protein
MKRFRNFTLPAVVALLLTSGCEKGFDALNTNPNDPVALPAELLLPNAIRTAANTYWGGSLGQDVGSGWAQHWARIQYTEIDQYNFTTDVIDGPWQTFYTGANANFQRMIKLGEEGGNENIQAIGIIMRSWTFSLLTDLYGDIPYKQALQGIDGALLPAYDKQKDVYAGLVADLKRASELINTDPVAASTDILFRGDMTKWKKFANSLSLRLLNRMIGKADSPIDARAEMARILSDPTKYPVLTSNADNVALVFLADAPNNNPINQNRKTRDDHRVGQVLVDKLKALGDPRLDVYASKAAATGEYVGVPNGLSNVEAGNLGLARTSKVGTYFVAATAPAVLLSFAELNFIKAEAALRGVTAAGNAAKAYEDGIRASMAQYGLTAPAAYLTAHALKTGPAARVQVLEQKWLALFGQGLEAWTEFRRTGVPALKVPALNYNAGIIPTRLPYPSSEENLNTENFRAALGSNQNTMQFKLWWAE